MLVSFLTTLERYLPVQVEGSRGDRTYEMESGAAIDQNVLGVSFGDDHTAIDVPLKRKQPVKQSKRSTSPRALGTSPS
jgi:hypothetical protein